MTSEYIHAFRISWINFNDGHLCLYLSHGLNIMNNLNILLLNYEINYRLWTLYDNLIGSPLRLLDRYFLHVSSIALR